VESNFVYLFPVLNTEEVPLHLKPYLPLLLELLMESPILEDDATTLVPYEVVVAQLAADFLVAKAGLGLKAHRFLAGSYGQAAILQLQTVPAKYATAVRWVRRLLYQTKLTADRVRVLAAKMENSVSELKREGSKVTSMLMNSVLFTEASNHSAANMFRQQKFLG
jgi:Zn-dependent M16 (insulinase) family peptidase